jgi:hypothetical protein
MWLPNSPLAAETPVLIAGTLDAVPHDERLFNLSAEVPPGFSRFASLIEVVGQDREERRRPPARQVLQGSRLRGQLCRSVGTRLMADDGDLISRANSLINPPRPILPAGPGKAHAACAAGAVSLPRRCDRHGKTNAPPPGRPRR